ncbi:MAG: polysaccharide biosynthesis/export family protein [Pseudomonadota bacterium]
MGRRTGRGAKLVALALIATMVAACSALLRSGPNKREIFSGSILRQGDAFVVPVDAQVTKATGHAPRLGFSAAFREAPPIGADTIRPGDALGLVVYENVEDGLLSGPGAPGSVLEEVQVDGQGFIFIPYAGRLRAAGNTPETLRQLITARLDEQTPDPQVLVRRLAGDGATVSIVGGAAAQGVYPIERPTNTLTAMIARAGGLAVAPAVAMVTVTRGGRTETASLRDLYVEPHLDIPLRDGDTIFIEEDTRAFTVLGATGGQTRLEFQTDEISAMDAIAQVGGLVADLANPTGVFVFRDESEAVARAVLGREDIAGEQRMVYVLDLTEPNGMFEARDFLIRDGDTLYVTEAPVVAWNRAVAAIFGSLRGLTQPITTATAVTGGL